MGLMGRDLVLTSDLDKLFYQAGRIWIISLILLLFVIVGRFLSMGG